MPGLPEPGTRSGATTGGNSSYHPEHTLGTAFELQVKVPLDARSVCWRYQVGVEHVTECKTHREVVAGLVELRFEVAYRAPAWGRRQVRKRRGER